MTYGELKTALIDDLQICISYEPNKENDLLCMMEQYLNTEDKRCELLPKISNCIVGKPYQNPFNSYYFYSEGDIRKLTQILDDYIQDMNESNDAYTIISNTICQIGELQDKCGGELIDEYRKPKLEEFLLKVAESVDFNSALALIESQKRW